MRKAMFLGVLICALLLMFACAKPEDSTNRSAATSASPATSPATTTTTTTTTTNAAADAIGVAECDNFLAAYDACVNDKVPEMSRAQYNTALSQWRSSWKALAANPQAKATLAATCKQAMEQARSSMKTYNCTF